MNDPYRVLGVSPNATDDEVKEAYRSLAKKYHPDNYAGSPIADLASEKMKEVNEAYDQVTSERKAARQRGSSSQNAGGQSASENYHQYWGGGYQTSTGFGDVRSLIATGRIADAEQILNGVPTSGRNAEWFFLKGTVLYKRGWLDEAIISPGLVRWIPETPSTGQHSTRSRASGMGSTAAIIPRRIR